MVKTTDNRPADSQPQPYEPTHEEITGRQIATLLQLRNYGRCREVLDAAILHLESARCSSIKDFKAFENVPWVFTRELGYLTPSEYARSESLGFFVAGDIQGWSQTRLIDLPGVGAILADRFLAARESLYIHWQDAHGTRKHAGKKNRH